MLEALGTFTASRAAADKEIHPTAGNMIGRARYDFFLTDDDALFAAMAPRVDPFAGLDLRLQNQLGYLRNLYNPADNHRLWMEVGYDFTYDNLSTFAPYGAPPIEGPAGIDKVHSGRAFLGYTNLMTPLATLNLGIEYLYDFGDSSNSRVNATGEFSTSVSTRFKLSLLSRILFDHKPVDDTKVKTDYVSTVQLVFTYDSITPPPSCPACDCTDKVEAAKSACREDATVSPGDLNPPPSAYIPAEEPAVPTAAQPQPVPAQPAPAKPTP
jgi:putative salt-induced outer membrane protein